MHPRRSAAASEDAATTLQAATYSAGPTSARANGRGYPTPRRDAVPLPRRHAVTPPSLPRCDAVQPLQPRGNHIGRHAATPSNLPRRDRFSLCSFRETTEVAMSPHRDAVQHLRCHAAMPSSDHARPSLLHGHTPLLLGIVTRVH